MREQRTFSIKGHGDKQFTVKELSVGEIIDLLNPERYASTEWKDWFTFFTENVLPKATSIDSKYVKKMTPSELKIVWEKFKEANTAFFDFSEVLGTTEMLGQLKPALCGAFGSYVADSLSRGMSERRGTDSAISSMPSMSMKKPSSKSSPPRPTPPESGSTQTKSSGKSSSEAVA
jgi:hypothetical protein